MINNGFFNKLVVVVMLTNNLGCATVILDNDKVMSPPVPDLVRLDNPTCVKLNFKTHNIGFFNEDEGLKPMDELNILRASAGLSYYNIIQNCTKPIAEYTIIASSHTRHWWARSVWAFSSLVSLGIIPFYVKEIGVVTLLDSKGQVISEMPYEEKRLTSIFVLPKWFSDLNKSAKQYSVGPDIATIGRREAVLIRNAIDKSESIVYP